MPYEAPISIGTSVDFDRLMVENAFHNALSIWTRKINQNSSWYREDDQGPRLDNLTFLTAEILNGDRFMIHDMMQKIEFAPYNAREHMKAAVIGGPGYIPFMMQTMGMTLFAHANPKDHDTDRSRQMFKEMEKIFAKHCKSKEPLLNYMRYGYSLAASAKASGWLPKAPAEGFLMPSLIPKDRLNQLRPQVQMMVQLLK